MRAELRALADIAEETGRPLEEIYTKRNHYGDYVDAGILHRRHTPLPLIAVQRIAGMLTPREFGTVLRAGRTNVSPHLHASFLRQAEKWALLDAQIAHLGTTTYALPRVRLERLIAAQLAKTIAPSALEWHPSTFPNHERRRGHTKTLLGTTTRPSTTAANRRRHSQQQGHTSGQYSETQQQDTITRGKP